MRIRHRLALLICPDLVPDTCDVTAVFRAVGAGDSVCDVIRAGLSAECIAVFLRDADDASAVT
ncbi:hypothetical protein ACROSR_01225 [Roseovarius tibetensis]|uniref:hypothetical protein n=1 Tax=Roseovarius tibetensis TaxID=2685897 RepID=UPI003D7F198E